MLHSAFTHWYKAICMIVCCISEREGEISESDKQQLKLLKKDGSN